MGRGDLRLISRYKAFSRLHASTLLARGGAWLQVVLGELFPGSTRPTEGVVAARVAVPDLPEGRRAA